MQSKKIFPKKRFSQNFLVDPGTRRKILQACCVSADDHILEIGSGRGELTVMFAEVAKKLFAVELDRDLCVLLKEKLAGFNNVELIAQDILKVNFSSLGVKSKLKIIGNLPYNISTPIIEHLIAERNFIKEAFIMVQKEYAERVSALPGGSDYGSLSCFVQYYFEPKILLVINRGCFFPKPKVDSAFLHLIPRKKAPVEVKNEEELFKLIRRSFQQRRKTLRKCLKGVVEQATVDKVLSARKLSPLARPQELVEAVP